MTIKYLDSKRISGITADRTGSPEVPAVSGGWKEVGRTTLGSAGDDITVSSLDDKRYYMVLTDKKASGDTIPNYRLNNDSGSNYSQRVSINGAADGTAVSQTEANGLDPYNANNSFNVQYISNLAGKEKLAQGHFSNRNATGSGNDPRRSEFVWKWANTSDAINRIDVVNPSSGSFDTGSECVVLGWDDSDTHTTNFWEELASVELGSAGANLGSGTISAKKYLWIQTLIKPAAACNVKITFNSDTSSNYTDRYSHNGGSDSTRTSQANMSLDVSGNNALKYYNLFVINNSANEKLVLGHSVDPTTTGVGTAPDRVEHVAKWVNTSAQITDIDFDSTSGNYAAGSILKVWGSN